MHRLTARLGGLFFVLALGLAACGGGGGDTPAPQQQRNFGWWAQGYYHNNRLADPIPGDLALVSGQTVEQLAAMVEQADALGKKPVVMLWALLWDWEYLHADWATRLDELLAKVNKKAWAYYVADEPYFLERTAEDLDKVLARLPPDKLVLMSLSAPEVVRQVYVPKRVDWLGANLYSGQGESPDTAPFKMGLLARYGKPMYVTLDAMALYYGPDWCDRVPEDVQRRSIAVNEALLQWADSRSDVPAIIAFLWQNDGDVCGAESLPLIREYVFKVAGALKP